jgi:hypothetical protein
MIRLALTERDTLAIHLRFARSAPSEDGAFLLLRSEQTSHGARLVASEPYFPERSEWDRIGPSQLRPSARLLSAMISRSLAARAGVLFIHSHPDPDHPTDFSNVDLRALEALGETIPDLMDGPFAAALDGPGGWCGLLLLDQRWTDIDRITAAGSGLRILNPLPEPNDDFDDRQRSALGQTHTMLRNLDVAIVGSGGLGSPLAESLVRMGVRRLVVIDYDELDTPSDVRRVFGSRVEHLHQNPKQNKVDVVSNHCTQIGLPVDILGVPGDVRRPGMLPLLLDSDVIMCATDSHSSRAVLDAVAYAFHLPLIDCGVRVGIREQHLLASLVGEIRIVGPDLPCLWCMEALSGDRIRVENLPSEERKELALEGYVAGIPGHEPSTAALTLFGAGMMGCALLGLLSEESDVLPRRYVLDGLLGDAPTPRPAPSINPACICVKRQGKGSDAPLGLLP